MPGQEKMTLRSDIKYKSNWQHGTLKAQRRNKWICALKASMEKVKIYGPGGNPNVQTGPTKYTLVPYEEVRRGERDAAKRQPTSGSSMSELHIPKSDWTFADQNSAIGMCPLPSPHSCPFFSDVTRTDTPDLPTFQSTTRRTCLASETR